jgi:hypothetical protein
MGVEESTLRYGLGGQRAGALHRRSLQEEAWALSEPLVLKSDTAAVNPEAAGTP